MIESVTSWLPGTAAAGAAQRWLGGELIEGDDSRTYATITDDDADFEYVFETWQFWIIVMLLSLFIAIAIFYFSYKQEVCCGVHNNKRTNRNRRRSKVGEDIETGRKLATKTFQVSRAFDRLSEEVVDLPKKERNLDGDTSSSSNSSSGSSSSHTTTDASSSKRSSTYLNKIHSLVSSPRCVLCSKAYVIGECITHCSSGPTSAACHHEFHETCLRKYWTENKVNNGKCPVCKIEYCCGTDESPSPSSDSHPPC